MPTALITGANRGLGLALATRYAAAPGAHVIAVTREISQSHELHALVEGSGGRVRALEADVAEFASIERLAHAVEDSRIDLLINNAGMMGETEFGKISARELNDVFSVNAFAPLLLTQALRAKLARGGKVVNITSVLGSIQNARDSASYLSYAMSKAALNMFSVKLAAELRADGIAVLALRPGWVRTRMGGSEAAIDVDTSADGMMRVIGALDLRQSGSYLAYDGKSIPW
jgi:NAD(P)-dependent dehydrogenase (short-subunit alcohol dehydrogenase family)